MDEIVELFLSLDFIESKNSKPMRRVFLRKDYTFILTINSKNILINIKGYIPNTEVIEFLWRITFTNSPLCDFLLILKEKLTLKKIGQKLLKII